MPSATYAVFRKAILAGKQVVCSYEGRPRELCPHIIGTNRNGEAVVLAWQFGGESSGRLPQWRCLKLANVQDARARDGRRRRPAAQHAEQFITIDLGLLAGREHEHRQPVSMTWYFADDEPALMTRTPPSSMLLAPSQTTVRPAEANRARASSTAWRRRRRS